MSLIRYRPNLVRLFNDLKALRVDPGSISRLVAIQESLIREIVAAERRLRRHEQRLSQLKRLMTSRLGKAQAAAVKRKVRATHELRTRDKCLMHVYRTIGDGLAFQYIPRWDIKPMAFKSPPGFVSGKAGARRERDFLRRLSAHGHLSILTDLTNCLRYGDLIAMSKTAWVPIEVKSSHRRNQRAKRQMGTLDQLMEYIRNDKTDGWYRDNFPMQRVEAHSEVRDHIASLNGLLAGLNRQGLPFVFDEVEKGLYYFVGKTAQLSETTLPALVMTAAKTPMICILNEGKYSTTGYFPLSLAISEANDWFDFYEGDLIIAIVVDFDQVSQQLSGAGFEVELQEPDSDYTIILVRDEGTPNEMLSGLSRHFWGRIWFEFVSLGWLLDEAINGTKVIEAMGAESEDSPNARGWPAKSGLAGAILRRKTKSPSRTSAAGVSTPVG